MEQQPETQILNGGVLIIGSLLWDPSVIRVNWRQKNLSETTKFIFTPCPIRYGRISQSRNCTFSMVFSTECCEPEKMGTGKFAPFKKNPLTLDDLWLQCSSLIAAEADVEKPSFQTYNWSWGSLGLKINPNSFKDPLKKDEIDLLVKSWPTKFGKKNILDPEDFKIGEEKPVLNSEGFLQIEWPEELKAFDFFIATATKPKRTEYPTATDITQRMTVNEYDEYFRTNYKEGIVTFQDNDILKNLKNFK